MKNLKFKDIKTGEEFIVKCEAWQIHSIETINKELAKWCEGRIIFRTEI